MRVPNSRDSSATRAEFWAFANRTCCYTFFQNCNSSLGALATIRGEPASSAAVANVGNCNSAPMGPTVGSGKSCEARFSELIPGPKF
jgi:hypothetical protein